MSKRCNTIKQLIKQTAVKQQLDESDIQEMLLTLIYEIEDPSAGHSRIKLDAIRELKEMVQPKALTNTDESSELLLSIIKKNSRNRE
jgi:hypothetical protein